MGCMRNIDVSHVTPTSKFRIHIVNLEVTTSPTTPLLYCKGVDPSPKTNFCFLPCCRRKILGEGLTGVK